MDKQVRVRFAPSPTGALHIGGARTAYFNWLFARQQQGVFVLRIDDTDRARSTEESYRQILDSFRWLGIDWDEGPDCGGPYGPYRQSERTEIYRNHLQRLIAEGKVYPCFCSAEQLQADREEAAREGRPSRYSGRCRDLSAEERERRLAAGEPHVYRLRTDATGETVVHDLIRGDVVFQNSEIDDFIVWKADDSPTYHFASCVDDLAMRISHVIRAEEHLSNTPRHVTLFEAFGSEAPAFAHVPMILAPDRSKLSKRHGATSVSEYREMGILPEALVNYLLLLGFSPGDDREIVDRETAIEVFSLDRVAKHAAVYDVKKLEWLNAHYFRAQSPDVVVGQIWDELVRFGYVAANEVDRHVLAWIRTVVEFVQTRSRNAADLIDGMRPYFEGITAYDDKGVRKQFSDPATPERLRAVAQRLAGVAPFTAPVIESSFRALIDELGLKAGQLIHPVRLALTGVTVGPGLFDVIAMLGREEACQRLEIAAERIASGTVATK
ncbi:glutamyl-tRNA synthetase [Alicyclobacillus hesperidum URH17-3-68]|uniref:Glutamate--tRNA ligase n=1 Tax=Alicyclobacillus hesperidum TaxID=89784 RepID=A0A1H2TBF9_9BACL|nr:glutamate--tRNA ligase [Alicyclobacillus hesperidum]EJY56000.1 glutamyl-tRNA synthetase [Alicyclobacillus hesperidum URH17-3-68]GLV13836.1 glutamate--tRNA ligase [Alicyclobacillus hesperidum]SDW41222.1 glutamyl-tRNA synthetase [Alicyclobacillus hesperidum]